MKIYFLSLIFTTIIIPSLGQISIITNSVTPFGKWDEDWTSCPPGSYFKGFDLKSDFRFIHPRKKDVYDNLGIGSLVFECNKPNGDFEEILMSSINGVSSIIRNGSDVIGNNTTPGTVVNYEYKYPLRGYCTGTAVGFQIMMEYEQIAIDNSGANNLRLICSDTNADDSYYIEGFGRYKGDWSEEYRCPVGYALCGFAAQSEPVVDSSERPTTNPDNTAINNIRFKCCQVASPAETCEPEDKWELVQECDNVDSNLKVKCSFLRRVGLTLSNQKLHKSEYYFYERLGYDLNENTYELSNQLASNFRETLSESSGTGYNWSEAADEAFVEESSNFIELDLDAGFSIKIFQVVGSCSYYSVRTSKFKLQTISGYQNSQSNDRILNM